MSIKILVLGHARHGKDTVAEFLAKYANFSFQSSSMTVAGLFYDKFKHLYGYETVEECFADRVNHRAEWYELIKAYNAQDKAALAKEIYANCDIYVGCREPSELSAVLAEFSPLVIWVDASDRLPLESESSMAIKKEHLDGYPSLIEVKNNGTEQSLNQALVKLCEVVKPISDHKWQQRCMNLACEVATWSKDPDCRVGAVLVSPDRRSFSPGYNGVPKGLSDQLIYQGKETKLKYTKHAESNAILNANQDVTGWSLFVTKPVCVPCALDIIQAGIARVYHPPINQESSWAKENAEALSTLLNAKIDTIQIRHPKI